MKRLCTWFAHALSISAIALLVPSSAMALPDGHSRHRPPSFMDRYDTDSDGLVSFDEFTAAFGELDADGDGFIDSDEAPKPPHARPGRRGAGRPANDEGGNS